MTYPFPSYLYWPGLQDNSIEAVAFVSTSVSGGVVEVEDVLGMPVTAGLVNRDDQSALTLGTVRNVEVDDGVGRRVSGKVF